MWAFKSHVSNLVQLSWFEYQEKCFIHNNTLDFLRDLLTIGTYTRYLLIGIFQIPLFIFST